VVGCKTSIAGSLAVLTLVLILCQSAGCSREEAVVAWQDPLTNVSKAENEVQVLKIWAENRVKADVLVHIDALDDIGVFATEFRHNIENAGAHLKRGNIDVIDRLATLIERKGTINVGYEAGFYKRVIWVLPARVPPGEEPIETLKAFLKQRRGYREKSLANLQPSGKYVKGELGGVPILITNLENLDVGDEEVILDIDLTYVKGQKSIFPQMQVGTRAMLDVIGVLREKKMMTRFATVNLSTLDEICPMDIRFLGDVVRESLIDPSKLGSPVYEKWNMMMEAEDSLVVGNFESAAALYGRLIETHGNDPGLHFSMAVVRGFMDDGVGSREALARASELDASYMRGFIQLARLLSAGIGFETAIEILESPYLEETMSKTEVELQKAVCCLNAKRYEEALDYLNTVSIHRPKDFSIRTMFFRAHEGIGDKVLMMMDLENLRKIDEGRVRREMPWVFKRLGELYEEHKANDRAIEAYERYLESVPPDESTALIQEIIDMLKNE